MEIVTLNLIRAEGFETFQKPADEALALAKADLDTRKGTFFINGSETNIQTITVEEVESAGTITVMHAIQGGTDV